MAKKLSLIPILILIILAGLGLWFVLQLGPVGVDRTPQRFVIVKGSAASQVALSLEKEKLIKNSFAFRIYAKLSGASTRIQAGEYELNSNQSVPQIITTFLKGPTEVWVTIPEGFRREQIVEKFVSDFGLKGDIANTFVQDFLQRTEGREGYLFPDTYLFPKDSTPSAIVQSLTSTFNSKVGTIDKSTLILASILERETITEEERPIVAGILLKRLNAGWPLQADATVQYIKDTQNCKANAGCKWWEPVVGADLQIDSSYNTYKYAGLPPAPISNPGLSSIRAAQKPQDSVFWYYLHDKSGVIHYATTIEEHNDNIKKYLE